MKRIYSIIAPLVALLIFAAPLALREATAKRPTDSTIYPTGVHYDTVRQRPNVMSRVYFHVITISMKPGHGHGHHAKAPKAPKPSKSMSPSQRRGFFGFLHRSRKQ